MIASASNATVVRRYDRSAALLLALLDLFGFLAAAFVAEAIVFRTVTPHILLAIFVRGPFVFVVLWPLLFRTFGLYRISFAMTNRDQFYAVATALALGIVPQLVVFTLVPSLNSSRLVLVVAAGMALVLVGSARAFAHAAGHVGYSDSPYEVTLRLRTPVGQSLKRTFDIVVALPILILAAPFMLIAAIAIVLETGSPVFFRQQRVGRDGRVFSMLKFRSMYVGHGRDAWATRGDPRITRVGGMLRRTSIDELPQLLNVLRGEMSIVGPRPEMPCYVERFESEIPHYADRHLCNPGITGWSQLYMDRVLTPDDVRDVLRHDLFYVNNWGLFMDLSIIVKTAFEFLFHRPA